MLWCRQKTQRRRPHVKQIESIPVYVQNARRLHSYFPDPTADIDNKVCLLSHAATLCVASSLHLISCARQTIMSAVLQQRSKAIVSMRPICLVGLMHLYLRSGQDERTGLKQRYHTSQTLTGATFCCS